MSLQNEIKIYLTTTQILANISNNVFGQLTSLLLYILSNRKNSYQKKQKQEIESRFKFINTYFLQNTKYYSEKLNFKIKSQINIIDMLYLSENHFKLINKN